MLLGGPTVLVSLLAVLVSRVGVFLSLFVLADVVQVSGLEMMMGRSLMMSGRLMMMLARGMLVLRHDLFPFELSRKPSPCSNGRGRRLEPQPSQRARQPAAQR
jgi:hypothetical protein